jgi:acyl-CoA synthetase (AMP-forming)/AMP-acid ligase II
MTMLYDLWQQVARAHRDELALRDVASGRRWTFGQLAAAGEAFPAATGPVLYPRGHAARFIIEVLGAWRGGKVVCPLEPDAALPAISPPPAWCVHLKTTSATTGQARIVAFRAEQLAADAANIVATMGLRPDWPNLATISMAHSYGFSNLVLPLLLHGIPLIIAPSPLPEIVRRAAEGEPALTLPAVPALWRAWHEAGAIPPSVRLALSAGAPLTGRLEQDVFRKSGLKIHNFYGSSECGGIAYDRSAELRPDDALVGTPLENVALAMSAESCLQVRSRAVAEGYWPESHDHLGAGLFQTSDLGDLVDGAVFWRGRSSDLINVAGRKVTPEVIERVLLEHPLVREALVVGLPSAEVERAETIAAIVATLEPVTEATLRHFLLARLPAWQVPRRWQLVPTLHTSRQGKVSRTEWRQRLTGSRQDV